MSCQLTFLIENGLFIDWKKKQKKKSTYHSSKQMVYLNITEDVILSNGIFISIVVWEYP